MSSSQRRKNRIETLKSEEKKGKSKKRPRRTNKQTAYKNDNRCDDHQTVDDLMRKVAMAKVKNPLHCISQKIRD